MKSKYAVNPWSSDLHNIWSIDNLAVHDQYTGQLDTNANLLNFYHKFQIELVAETCCLGETFFPTEKTIRPIVGRRPVLIFGPQNFLSNLKQLGFQTYSQCWDESYDNLEGQRRWQAMLEVIQHIVDHGYNVDQARSIAQHNAQHLLQWHKYTTPRTMPRVIHD